MERINTVTAIISIPPITSEKDLVQRSSSISNFQDFFFNFFTKKQIKQINNLANKSKSINELFVKEKFTMEFDPSKLNSVIKIINSQLNDNILIHHLALFVLYQYISFILHYEQTPNCESAAIIFNSLVIFSQINFQNLIYAALKDILNIIMSNYSKSLFDPLFETFSNFLLTHKDLDDSIYSFLPSILDHLIQDYGFTSTSISSKFSSLISLILSRDSKAFSASTISHLFQVIHPFLETVNEFALVLMQYLAPLLELDQLNTFFLNLPSIIPQVIELNDTPFITPPPEIEYESFSPCPSPQCNFGFPEVETFVSGFDASSTPHLPTPSLMSLVNRQVFYLIDLVVKVIGNGSDEAVLFLDAFSTLVDAKSTSKFRYDYLGLMVFIWVKITDKLPIEQIKVPKCLFEPTLSVFDEKLENCQFFFSLRFYGLSAILKVADSRLDELLLENVKYPLLLTELVEICNLNLDKVSTLIMNQRTMIRTIRLIGLQLQSAEFNNEISVKFIESARLAVFRLIFRLFVSKSFVRTFLDDILFMSFFFSLLFEKNVRPFVLSQLKVYITCDLSPEQFEVYINQLCQVIDQVCRVLPQENAFYLISDILSNLTSSTMKPELMIDFCLALQRTLQFFDDSDMARFLLLQIISFYTYISNTTSKLPSSSISSLEIPLKKFKDLGEKDLNALVCLAVGDKLTSYKPAFIIKNGGVVNIMFRVFYNITELDIVEYISKLTRFSIKNCTILHYSHFDITLLDFLIENRDSDDPRIPTILDVVTTIASCISSPAVVQRYISLFIPEESRYLTKTHQYLLKPLLTAFQRTQMSPSLVLPLNKKYILQTTVSKAQLEKEGFTFCFWLYYIESDETTIFSLLNGDEKPFFTIGMKENSITLNGKQKPLTISVKSWTFVTFLYLNNTAIIYLNNDETWKSTNLHIKFAIGVPSVKIGDTNHSQALLGNFGLFDSFDPKIVSEIYPLGPRTIRIKRKPIFYFTQENMRQLTVYASPIENRTFTDILIRFFKVEIFLPLFAQLDLKLKNGESLNFSVHDVVSILKTALFVGEVEQHDFLQAEGFSIISHLLCSSSAKHATYQLYTEFFGFFDILVLEGLQKQLFTQIIMNFDLWMVASPEDHLLILQHWNKVVFNECKSMLLELLPFSYLLDILRIYYWYEPIEKSKIRGEPNSRRVRNPNLDISKCRATIYNIMYDISIIQFRNEDLSALIEHVITLEDPKQQLDLLLFMNTLAVALHYPLSKLTIPIPIITRLSYLLHSGNDQIVTAVFNLIFSVHLKANVQQSELTLVQHIDGLMKDIQMRKMTMNLLEDLKSIMLYNTPFLFPICSYIGYRLNSLELFRQTAPTERYVVNLNWALWATAEAMTINDAVKQKFIFSFLARCSIKQWQNLFDMIEIIAQAAGGNVQIDDFRASLLRIYLQIALKTDQSYFSHDILSSLFSMLKLHILFRRTNEPIYCSSALSKLFEESPFGLHSDVKSSSLNNKLRYLYHIDILNLNVDQYNYSFGLRIDSHGVWLDEDLARLTLQAIVKFKKVIDNLDFGFILAGFLLSSNVNKPTLRRAFRSNSTSRLNSISNNENELNSMSFSLLNEERVMSNSSFKDDPIDYDLLANIAPPSILESFENGEMNGEQNNINENSNINETQNEEQNNNEAQVTDETTNTKETSNESETLNINKEKKSSEMQDSNETPSLDNSEMPNEMTNSNDSPVIDEQQNNNSSTVSNEQNEAVNSNENQINEMPQTIDDSSVTNDLQNKDDITATSESQNKDDFIITNELQNHEEIVDTFSSDSDANSNKGSQFNLSASINIISNHASSKYRTQSNSEFVNYWLSEMQLVKGTLDSHKASSQFLVAKANMTGNSLIITTQLSEAYNGMLSILENFATKFYDNNTASSFLSTHRSMKSFSQQAANNLFLAQQQEIRNEEFENDINLATEIIQFNDENNSKLWQRLWSNAVSDGSPWDISKITGKRDKPRWKRDICSCKFFCPFKLKPNRKYTNHYESSIARDAGNKQNINRIIDEYKQRLIDEYKKNAPAELLEIPPSNLTDSTSSSTNASSGTTAANVNPANLSSSNNLASSSNSSTITKKKKKNMEYKCELVKMKGVYEGTFSVFSEAIHIDIESTKKTYILPTVQIKQILLRRRFHHKTAIEIFMDSGDSYFVNFPQYRSIQIVQRMILPDRVLVQKEEPAVFFAQSGLTEKWRKGEISNFEYLMMLNICSGRSFNDSSQYPFLPWVISDYTSETLDLEDPKSFRDLSKPIGAIGEARFKQIVKRMKDMEHFGSTPYLYSSFAICPLSLYLWLFRMEPFTSLHIDMQSGKFDHPSRLFSSIPDTYNIVTSNMNDYRELAPEFYFLPDFLRNDNELDLGKAKGVQLGDVVLPKWAKTCEECVYMFRKALESDIASSMLNKWIDLIWGYKQRGEKAVESDNIYCNEMYETAWTPQVLKDPRRRAEIEASMCHVGQFPPQLFTTEHPERIIKKRRTSTQITILKLPYTNIKTACLCYSSLLYLTLYTSSSEIACLSLSTNSLSSSQQQSVTTSQANLGTSQISASSSNFNQTEIPTEGQIEQSGNIRILNDKKWPVQLTVVSIKPLNGSNEFICLLSNAKIIQIDAESISLYHSELTRVSSISHSTGFIGAVSDDTTLNLFGKNLPSYTIPFYGNSVLCCALSTAFKIAVCGTVSGDIVVSSLYEGRKINVIKLGKEFRPTKLLISKSWGFIITYATTETSGGQKAQHFIFVHNINGTFIRSVNLQAPIATWCTFSSKSDFDYLIISFDQGKLHLCEVFYMDIGDPFYRCYGPVVDILCLKDLSTVAVVKDDGNVIFLPICLD